MLKFSKALSLTVSAVLAASVFAGCSSTSAAKKDGKLSIVCTTFSEYDWTKNIIRHRIYSLSQTVTCSCM